MVEMVRTHVGAVVTDTRDTKASANFGKSRGLICKQGNAGQDCLDERNIAVEIALPFNDQEKSK